jgi:plastocyanin
MRRKGSLFTLVVLAGLLCAAEKPAGHEVSIRNLRFEPAELSIKAGETVKWTNDDDRDHTVVSRDKESKFKSPILHQGDTWQMTFDKAGKFPYGCRLHPRMRGTIIVLAK